MDAKTYATLMITNLERKIDAARQELIANLTKGGALAGLIDYQARPLVRMETELAIWTDTAAGGWIAGTRAAMQRLRDTGSSTDSYVNGTREAAREAARGWLAANRTELEKAVTAADLLFGM
ncbi:hypothetical protein [Saccharothrix xinjiangensis]|uniref:Excreted virulence factor EspC (Type VII ESX diderm) n=1 Tax=Saccharothrix xinjiangensis TaxID=204798 RepID=A0ABV9XWL6_9PSEU